MFGTVLSFAHPIIILILTIMPVINYFVIRSIQKFQYKSKNETIPLDKNYGILPLMLKTTNPQKTFQYMV